MTSSGLDLPIRPTTREQYGLFIGGEWVSGSGSTDRLGRSSTGRVFAQIVNASAADVGRAVDAATLAFTGWGRSAWGKRAAVLDAIADRIADRADHLAAVESLDAGKPIRQARTWDLPVAVESFRYFAAAARLQTGEVTTPAASALNLQIREPLGPVAQIVPWNGSVLMLGWKLAPALAAGCTVVVKPSEQASVAALETGGRDRRPAASRSREHRHRRCDRWRGADVVARHQADQLHRQRRGSVGTSCRRPRRTSRRSLWSWAARARTSSCPTPISTPPYSERAWRSCPIRVRCAWPVRG